ncbi:prepilin peptidase [Candidatus Parcubacteria bacterium]|nr:MAG: prepilin peptidase [Candidatus Parcubacteria bacterium]
MDILRFFVGACLGSFVNLIALRYDPDKFLFRREVVLGRSRCPGCGKPLRWFELIPFVSFLLQLGRCRRCGAGLSIRYPLVELAAGLIVLFVPARLEAFSVSPLHPIVPIAWISAMLLLFLVALVDARTKIIPDEANILLVALGAIVAWYVAPHFSQVTGSFVGSSALLLGYRENVLVNRVVAVVFSALLFGFLVSATRGRGMGMGDAKLGLALAVLFGWPDVLLIFVLSFIIGSITGFMDIAFRKRTLKSHVPFGPFLVLASALVFFWGEEIVGWYVGLIRT